MTKAAEPSDLEIADHDAICSTTTIAALLMLGAQFPHRQFNSAELCVLSGIGRTAMSQIKNAPDTPFSLSIAYLVPAGSTSRSTRKSAW